MNPFQVQASTRDVGYYAENTLAGSRLNTNVGDLASSITVVTKQQMLDTASVNINDIFMYEANTEGANTYMPFFLNRSAVRDTLGGFSPDTGTPGMGVATANRIRGLDVSDVAINNYPSSSRIPFDTYNTSSVEINRGPNSLLFGTGSPAGITNQSTNSAVLGQRKTEVTYQFGRWGTYRGSISHNQPLGDKLAIYVAALYTHNGFERKPSFDIYRRQYGALTYQPFRGTRITASFENFDNINRRPNYVLPRDGVTPWLAAGRPAWNPATQMMTIMDTGRVLGPYLTDTRDTRYAATIAAYPALSQTLLPSTARINIGSTWLSTLTSPLYVSGIQFRSAHNYMLVNQGSMLGFWQSQPSGTSQPSFPTGIPATTGRAQQDWVLAANRPTFSNFPQSPLQANGTGLYATWIIPGVTNRAIYDWQSVNASSVNFGQMGAKTYNIELQQEILSSLNLDVGWFRQEIEERDNYPLGQSNQISSLYVDTNQVMPDGSANPYFGSPLEQDYQNDTYKTPEINNNWRALLSYEKDFTTNSGWTRWLGRHRLLGLWSRQEDTIRNLRYRLSVDGGDTRYLPNSATAGWSYFGSNFDHIYYLGQNQHGTVQYAPGYWNPPLYGGIGSAPINTYNFLTHAYEPANISFEPIFSFAGTNAINQKILEGQNFAWQGYFLNNRIVGTVGWRRDDYRARQTSLTGTTSSQQNVNGFAVDSLMYRMNNWFYLRGRTKTAGVVVRPLVWSSGSLGFHLNRSDNFNPPNGTPKDFFGNNLGKPQGKGKDYGVDLTLFDNKLVARINWFQSDNQNANAAAANTAIGRVQRIDTSSMRPWAEWVVRIRNGDDITSFFANNTVHPLSTTEISQIEALMNAPNYSYINNGWPYTQAATQEDIAKGLEAQVIYNPMRNWNIKLTVGKQKSVYDKVAPELDAWLAQRMPVWTSAVATDIPNEIFVTTGAAGSGTTQTLLANFWHGYGFSADARLSAGATNTGSSNVQAFYNSAVATEIAVAKALQGQIVPNERLWSWNLISNYAFTSGFLRGASVGGAVRWDDRAIASYYGDTVNLNSAGQVAAPDITRPIYTPSQTHLDVWASYTTKIPRLFGDKVQVRFQLNVRDLTEKGGLQVIAFNFDGSPASYRIVDPRQYYFTTTLDF